MAKNQGNANCQTNVCECSGISEPRLDEGRKPHGTKKDEIFSQTKQLNYRITQKCIHPFIICQVFNWNTVYMQFTLLVQLFEMRKLFKTFHRGKWLTYHFSCPLLTPPTCLTWSMTKILSFWKYSQRQIPFLWLIAFPMLSLQRRVRICERSNARNCKRRVLF